MNRLRIALIVAGCTAATALWILFGVCVFKAIWVADPHLGDRWASSASALFLPATLISLGAAYALIGWDPS